MNLNCGSNPKFMPMQQLKWPKDIDKGSYLFLKMANSWELAAVKAKGAPSYVWHACMGASLHVFLKSQENKKFISIS